MVNVRQVRHEPFGSVPSRKLGITGPALRRRVDAIHGLTYEELADFVDRTPQMIYNYFTGYTEAPFRVGLILEFIRRYGLREARRIASQPPMTGTELRMEIAKTNGMTQREFARVIGSSERPIRRWCQDDANVPRWMRLVVALIQRKMGVTEDIEDAGEIDRSWVSVKEAAERAGITPMGMRIWIEEYKVPVKLVRGRGKFGNEARVKWKDVRDIIADKGRRPAAVANRLRISAD